MVNIVLPKRRQILLQLEAMLATYDARTEPLSASEYISQVSTEGYINLARLALEQQAEIAELVDMLEKVLTDSVTGVVPQSHLDKIEKVIAKHKEKE